MTRTTCPYCGVGCGVAVVDGIPRGDEAHPANFGRLCSKGAALKDTLALPDRLTMPTIAWQARPSWDAALDHDRRPNSRASAPSMGPDAIAFYVSGQFLTEDYYVANKLMKGFIGSANIDTNSRLCMASSVAGHVRAFGEDVVPGCYEDLEEADLVVQVGSNMAWCHPVLYQRHDGGAREARHQGRQHRSAPHRHGGNRRPASGAGAGLRCAAVVRAAGLSGRMMAPWTATGSHAMSAALMKRWQRRAMPRRPRSTLSPPPPGSSRDDVRAFYDLFARTERVVTLYSQGVNQSVTGTDKVNAILNCHLATGAHRPRPAWGPSRSPASPMRWAGARSAASPTSSPRIWALCAEDDRSRAAASGRRPPSPTQPGLKAVDLFDAVHDGRIKAVWIAATNPADSMPRAGRVREALASCPLVVVADAWPTDTTKLAHVVLPAAGWAEKDGTVTNSERCISRQRAFRAAPGEARPDWWMFAEVARRMGWGDALRLCRRPPTFSANMPRCRRSRMTARALFDLGALCDLDDAAYDAHGAGAMAAAAAWPARVGRPAPVRARRLFHAGSASARMMPLIACALQEASRAISVLTLNTGRIRDQWHTMTRTGRVPHLMSHISSPSLALHPARRRRARHHRRGAGAASKARTDRW